MFHIKLDRTFYFKLIVVRLICNLPTRFTGFLTAKISNKKLNVAMCFLIRKFVTEKIAINVADRAVCRLF